MSQVESQATKPKVAKKVVPVAGRTQNSHKATDKVQQKKRDKKPSFKKLAAAKIALPYAKAENKEQKKANDEARRQRKVFILRERKKSYEAHMPHIPLPEKFATYSKAKKSLISKKLVKAEQEQLKQNLIRHHALKNAQKYLKEYNAANRELIAKRRTAKQSNTFYVEAEPRVVFVIRIRGINGVSPKVRKALQLLRLRQIHNGTFVKVNAASKQILTLVEPYITYGAPSLKSVSDLVYKRGHAKIGRDRIPLTSNTLIHDNLGKVGVHCMEDVIHEIYTCGPNFKQVNKFLWPFKLSSPKGGFSKKRIHFVEGGDAGDREHYINRLIQKMN